MAAYRLCSHAEVSDGEGLLTSLAHLERLTFAHYDGVVSAGPSFMRWYTGRPGMNPQVCQAAFCGDTLVSSVFVTLARMRLGGEVVVCGLVDTVMTHPDHRRRGLAGTLLRRALAAMGAAGAEVSLLNTAREEPIRPPERLYRDVGYLPRELVIRFWRQPGPLSAGGDKATRLRPDESARSLFERSLGERDGWLLLDDNLWRWRRQERPAEYPVALYRTDSGALAAVCCGELLVSGRSRSVCVVSDLVLPGKDALLALVGVAARDRLVTLLCPQSDASLVRLAGDAGFAAGGTEVAMLRPITERGARLLSRPTSGWYVALESLVGV